MRILLFIHYFFFFWGDLQSTCLCNPSRIYKIQKKKKGINSKIKLAEKIHKLTPDERLFLQEEKTTMRRMTKVQRTLYVKFFRKIPPHMLIETKKKSKKLPWWIDFVFMGLSVGYCGFCAFYVASFAATKGPEIAQAWFFSLLISNGQAVLVTDPIKCLILFVMLPLFAVRFMLASGLILDTNAMVARYRWRLLAYHVQRSRNKIGCLYSVTKMNSMSQQNMDDPTRPVFYETENTDEFREKMKFWQEYQCYNVVWRIRVENTIEKLQRRFRRFSFFFFLLNSCINPDKFFYCLNDDILFLKSIYLIGDWHK